MQPIKRTRTPKSESAPSENVNQMPQDQNQYNSILEMVSKLQSDLEQQKSENAQMKREIASAKWDISQEVSESKRKYGYNLDGTRRKDESFSFRYRVLIHDKKEKVVIESNTVGQPYSYQNMNTGKWVRSHNVTIKFHDDTETEMDVLDFINQMFTVETKVPDEDIEVKDGKKYYTFRTDKFGTFTVSENNIN